MSRKMVSPPAQIDLSRRNKLVRVGLVLVAVAIGLVLQEVVASHLAAIEERSHTDLLAARAQLAQLLEIGSFAVFGPTAGLGIAVIAMCRRSLQIGEFPPPGRWMFGGASRVVAGERARGLALAGIALGVLLIVASAAGGSLMWYIASVLRACRAGVGPI